MMGMGMGPLIPAGMVLTKPSEVKQQEKIALEKIEEEKKHQEELKAQQALENSRMEEERST